MLSLISAATLVFFAVPAVSQDPEWEVTRFDRITLRNGNFIDGTLTRNLKGSVMISIPIGHMTIRREDILKIEKITIRSLKEKPPEIVLPEDTVEPLILGVKQPGHADEPGNPGVKQPGHADESSQHEIVPLPASMAIDSNLRALLEQAARLPDSRKSEVLDKLVEMGGRGAVQLIGVLDKLEGGMRSLVMAALMRIRDPRTVSALRFQLTHPEANIRAHAVAAIGILGDSSVVRDVLPLIKDVDPGVRFEAAKTLVSLDPKGALGPVSALVVDTNEDVRERAFDFLEGLAKDERSADNVMGVLESLMQEQKGEMRVQLVASMGRVARADHWTTIDNYLNDDDAAVRSIAARTLGHLAVPDSGASLLRQMSSEEDAMARIQMARAVGGLRRKGAVTILVEWVSDENTGVKRAASTALRALTGYNFGPDSEKWDEWLRNSRRPR